MPTKKETRKIIIIGSGGNCTDILDTLLDINETGKKVKYECIGFLDDNPDRLNSSYVGVKVLGSLSEANKFQDCFFIFGIGSPSNHRKRREILATTCLKDSQFETIIHPSASVSRMAHIGTGTVIFQNATITSNVIIGRHVYILPNSIISHDTVVGDFTCIAGGVSISGKTHIGQSCYIGTNACVREGKLVGDFSLVGMGSVVVKDVPANITVFGNPAKPIRESAP